jgi:hypothetical protein
LIDLNTLLLIAGLAISYITLSFKFRQIVHTESVASRDEQKTALQIEHRLTAIEEKLTIIQNGFTKKPDA